MSDHSPVGAPSAVAPGSARTGDASATTSIRHEVLLGPVHVVECAERISGQRATQVRYELNVIDGWVRTRESTDASGLVWESSLSARCPVRAVLDAAPDHATFIANAHLAWVQALAAAGQGRRAAAQRGALDSALARHGLQVAPVKPTSPPPHPGAAGSQHQRLHGHDQPDTDDECPDRRGHRAGVPMKAH